MILDGKKLAVTYLEQIREQVRKGARPGLACILVGTRRDSHTYVTLKRKRCEEVGIASSVHILPDTVSEREFKALIETLNQDPSIHGILVQRPNPFDHLIPLIDPAKDVDALHPLNVGKLVAGDPSGFIPCTPLGVLKLLQDYGIKTAGKEIVIVGRSPIVGRPLSILLSQKGIDGTVTLAHSKTPHLFEVTKRGDILVAALGKPGAITGEGVKKGATVIDVGMTDLKGDVDFESVSKKAGALTPVPGGVGPMTIAMLLYNTCLAYDRSLSR